MFTCWLQRCRRVRGECVFFSEWGEYSDCSNKAVITIRLLHAVTNNNNNKAEIDCDFTLLYTCLQPDRTPPPTICSFTEPKEMGKDEISYAINIKTAQDMYRFKINCLYKANTGLTLVLRIDIATLSCI